MVLCGESAFLIIVHLMQFHKGRLIYVTDVTRREKGVIQ